MVPLEEFLESDPNKFHDLRRLYQGSRDALDGVYYMPHLKCWCMTWKNGDREQVDPNLEYTQRFKIKDFDDNVEVSCLLFTKMYIATDMYPLVSDCCV